MESIKKLLAVLVLLCLATVSHAAEKDEETEELHLDKHLLHRAAELARAFEGISFGLGLTGVLQGTINNEDVDPAAGNITDFSGSFDLELQREFGGKSSIFVLVEAGAGEGLMDETPFDSLLLEGVNDDAGSSQSHLEITEAWYEANLLEGRVLLTAGKVDLTNYFDTSTVANDETVQFLATTFVNNPAVEFPDNGPGARLTINFSDRVAFSAGLMEGDSDFEDVFDDLFVIGELDVAPELLSGRSGNYRFYGWLNGTGHVNLKSPAGTREEGYGFGFSFDQQMTDYLTLFARFGWQNDDVFQLEAAWSAGLEAKGALLGREKDVVGLAYARGITTDAVPGLDNEGHLEVYYNFFVNGRITFSPDLQVVFNPAGNSALDDVFVLGLRVQVIF